LKVEQTVVGYPPSWELIHARKGRETGNLPVCSPEERWEKPPVYAVMKRGRVRAVRLFRSDQDAKDFIAVQKDSNTLYVEDRPPESVRCLDYCAVSGLCDWWKANPLNPTHPLKGA